jgi:acetyl-CoA acetyltransferase
MRDVAVVAFAQSPSLRRDSRNEVEMLMPVVTEAVERSGIERREIGFTCSGSCDYLEGRPFAFVSAVDAVGAWPPIAESHVEMDGAWALYEAWLKIQTGEVDSALVYAFGKSSPGDLPEVLTLQLDPYTLAPLWPDALSLAALQARRIVEDSEWSERDLAEIAVRSRRSAKANPNAQLAGDFEVDTLLKEPYLASPLRRHDCPPISDGAAAVVLAAGDLARRVSRRPAWIRGIDHRIEPHALGLRDLTQSPSARLAAEKAGVAAGRVDVAELHAPFTHQELILREALGLAADVDVNPSGGALAANPMMAAGTVPPAEPRLRAGGRLMAERCAVIGIGQTEHSANRSDVSLPGLLREAASRALEDARDRQGARHVRGHHDARALPGGRARRRGQADAARTHRGKRRGLDRDRGREPDPGGRPRARADRRVREAVGEQRDVGAHGRRAVPAGGRGRRRGLLLPADPGLHATFGRAGGHRNPRRAEGSAERAQEPLRASQVPRHRLRAGGELADALGSDPLPRDVSVRALTDGAFPPAWVRATAMRSEPTMFAGRDQVNPQAGKDCAAELYRKAGIANPRAEIDCAEIYVPFSWFEPMWMENFGFSPEGEGWKMTYEGATALDGDLPVNMSGGVLSSNPIGASGMLRFAEAAMQVRGQAGEHQVDGARLALGHAYGGGSQFFASWIVAGEKP